MTGARLRTTAVGPMLALALAAGAAAAQSTRYPPEPVDADREADERSDFWERALEPDRGRYDVLLARARRLIDARTPLDLTAAAELLGQAIAIVPDAADAYYLRGWAHELAADWPACAADYTATSTRDPDFEPTPNPRTRGGLADGHGICLARAGQFEDAEVVLSQAAATGTANAAVWIRLGEVDIALGRLDDAIAALDSGLNVARATDYATIHWLRALAFDRARQPGDAADAAETALKLDPSLGRVLSPPLPSAPPEDMLYLAGLAYAAQTETRAALPELALLYFREFVKQARKSPWRRRAEEHVATLAAIDPTDALTRKNARQGTSTLDAAAIGKALRKDLLGLGRCLADAPGVVAELRLVVHGPPAPPPRRGQPIVLSPRPPIAGATAKVTTQVGPPAAGADVTAALRCVEQAAGKLKLPRLDKGTWVQLTLPVISR